MERAIRFTDPAYLPSSATIFDVPAPRLANLSSFWSWEPPFFRSEGSHLRVFMIW